jgi:copper chaperone
MKKYQFKTNINCSGCVANVTAVLDGEKRIKSWSVNTSDPSKILTVETEGIDEAEVRSILSKAGYRAEKIND